MKLFDKELQSLAKSGFRSTADWADFGRVVNPDAKPRMETKHRGQPMNLYSRDQTTLKPKVVRVKGPKPVSAAATEAVAVPGAASSVA